MRGHEPIVAMRRNGLMPAMVWIDTEPCALKAWAGWPSVDASHAHVWVEAGDSIKRTDLRFVVGLTVQVQGEDAQRVADVQDACVKAGAKRVLTYCNGAMTDTEGRFNG